MEESVQCNGRNVTVGDTVHVEGQVVEIDSGDVRCTFRFGDRYNEASSLWVDASAVHPALDANDIANADLRAFFRLFALLAHAIDSGHTLQSLLAAAAGRQS